MTRPDWSAIEARPALRDTHDPVSRYGPVVEPAPVEVVTEIGPREALRLGRLVYPRHGRGELVSDDGACAIGAMLAGWGVDPRRHNDDYGVPYKLLRQHGIAQHRVSRLWAMYDSAERRGRDGDAAVLAYLEGLGL